MALPVLVRSSRPFWFAVPMDYSPDMKSRASVALASALLVVAGPLVAQESEITRIVEFSEESGEEWIVVNDGVMGGLSSSDITAGADGVGVFEGELSLENNGGFASVRTALPKGALAGASSILVRVRGDGKRYQVRLRPGTRLDGIAYAATFETTAGQWITAELALDDFEPTFRGYRPPNAGPLDPAQVGQLGIMLTDEQVGPFRLEIEWIGVEGA